MRQVCDQFIKVQRSGPEAIRTQIQPAKQKREITEITKSRNTIRTYGQPSEQLFPKRWTHSIQQPPKNIFWIKNSIVMILSTLCSSIIAVYPLKISLSSDKFNVPKTSSIEDRGETIGISFIFCCFHPLQINKMIVFDNLI